MECTQKLENTQNIYETHIEKLCPEQIGFLGICGAKHPIVRGPNKIGRDPQRCNIVLNLHSVSRQHAVINILSSKEFMLMDLDSANKTKLLDKTLEPYIPHPLRNGDTVQFGDIFGIFRLLEEDDELPMTQAIDIPETPVASRYVSKINKATTTMIPESPDVSDRDDSYIAPIQAKNINTSLSNGQFIKPFGKTIPINPIISKKCPSPNSPKKAIPFVGNANTSLNDSLRSNESSISASVSTDPIYTADTQIPPGHQSLLSIHSVDTQIPAKELPKVFKIDGERDAYTANKENELNIFEADTQPFVNQNSTEIASKQETNPRSEQDLDKSNEKLLFDEIEIACLEEFNSQPLLPQESPTHKSECSKFRSKEMSVNSNKNYSNDDLDLLPTQKVEELSVQREDSKSSKRIDIMQSDDSTDCEDIDLPTQKIQKLTVSKGVINETENVGKRATRRVKRIQSDDSTDCEDIDIIPTQKVTRLKELEKEEDLTDCEDNSIEIISKSSKESLRIIKGIDLENMPTQIIDTNEVIKPALEDMNAIDNESAKSSNDVSFEDQPTQIVEELITTNNKACTISPASNQFKVPLVSPIRVKNKELVNVTPKTKTFDKKHVDDLDNYYNATQDILNDLCSQRTGSPILNRIPEKSKDNTSPILIDDDVVPCSVEDYQASSKFVNIDKDLSPTNANENQKIKQYVGSLSSQDIRDVIGVNKVNNLRQYPNDSSSDTESTPKKVRKCMFTDSDLPNSQEIETSRLTVPRNPQTTDPLSESELEENSEEQYSPLIRRHRKLKPVVKLDLTKKFDVEKLPERIITRVRKPTVKMEENLQYKKAASNILKSNYLTDQEDQINEDIIEENVKRLKTYEKAKNSKDHKKYIENRNLKNKNMEDKDKELETTKNEKNEIKVHTETKNNESKEKIKVKIIKPKKRESDMKSTTKEDASIQVDKEELTISKEKTLISQSIEVTNNKKHTDENKLKDSSLHSRSNIQVNTRSTRPRKKEKEKTNVNEKESVSPENRKKKSTDNKRKRPNKKREQPKELVPSEVQIRRSKRQADVKEKKSDIQLLQAPKSVLKKSDHEQSTVYSISSSGGESPRNLKRTLGSDVVVPSPKRTRAFVNSANNISNASLRATPARTMKTQNVLFTAFPSEEVKQKLEKLGAVVVTDVIQCSVVLTMQIKRTFKLLCAVGLGRPIVGPSWVQACVDTRMIVDPWLYLIKDEQAEKRFHFNLDKTLHGTRHFLKGYNISCTPSVQPNGSEMKLIVECSGGTWKEGGSNWVCISCSKDQALWPALRKRGATIVSTEFILGGVLKQKLDITSNRFP